MEPDEIVARFEALETRVNELEEQLKVTDHAAVVAKRKASGKNPGFLSAEEIMRQPPR